MLFPHLVFWWRWCRGLKKHVGPKSPIAVELGWDHVTAKATAHDARRLPTPRVRALCSWSFSFNLSPVWKLSCHDCYTAPSQPREMQKKKKREEWVLKQRGTWKIALCWTGIQTPKGLRENSQAAAAAAACIILHMILKTHIQYKWPQFACKSNQNPKSPNQI